MIAISHDIMLLVLDLTMWACGLMDKAPDFGSGDCRFESCHGRSLTFFRWMQNMLLQVRLELTTPAYL